MTASSKEEYGKAALHWSLKPGDSTITYRNVRRLGRTTQSAEKSESDSSQPSMGHASHETCRTLKRNLVNILQRSLAAYPWKMKSLIRQHASVSRMSPHKQWMEHARLHVRTEVSRCQVYHSMLHTRQYPTQPDSTSLSPKSWDLLPQRLHLLPSSLSSQQ